jgi:hypothetical protein
VNPIIVYELRDKHELTINNEYYQENECSTIQLNIEKYKCFLDSFTIFLLDSLGNTKKFKLN